MRRVSQQIGWSQESKLLYYVLRQFERLTAILGKNITTTTTTTLTPVVTSLKLTWNTIANVPVADPLSVSDWNTLFNLPTNGNPFTSVYIDPGNPNTVVLVNGSNIVTPDNLFNGNSYIISVEDVGSLVTLGGGTFAFSVIQSFSSTSLLTLGNASFYSCNSFNSITAPLVTSAGALAFTNTLITLIDFPNLVTAGDYCFNDTFYVTSVNLPALTTIGGYGLRQCGRYASGLTTISLPSLTTITGIYCFQACDTVQVFDFPLLQIIDILSFNQCYQATTFNLPACTNLGPSVLDNDVFLDITGQTITLTVPAALMTCNGGNPDGDIQALQASNTVTIVTV